MAVSEAHVFPGFLTPSLTQLSFQSQQLLLSHGSAEVKGENKPERKFSTGDKAKKSQLSNSQQPGHKYDTLTNEPTWQG